MTRILGFLALAMTALLAQETTPPAQQGPARQPPAQRQPDVKSPEVLPDNRVVFRIFAPKASEVSLTGDWIQQGRGAGGKLEKDESGVWSITVGPLVPDFYSYVFSVDGVRVLDPKNVQVKPGISTLSSIVEVPGDEMAYEATRDVPHGEIHTAWYWSKALNTMRSMHVYAPPGYETGNKKYPVLYLLHGSGDDDAGWDIMGRAGFILDNLLAAKQAVPMIVVMPNGSMPRTPGMETDAFTAELLDNVMPYVEKHYRTVENREKRALAGLSMGGGQTLRIGPGHLEVFAYLGVFSAGLRAGGKEQMQQYAGHFLDDAATTNKMLKLFWIGVGEKDQTRASAGNLTELLKAQGIKYEFHESEGGHTWINWRHYLHDYAPLLFR
jgi:enterochelin esterase-like enzyme